jgi:hypothetical protein
MPDCQKGGYTLVAEDGKMYKLDDAGNKKAIELYKATSSEKGLKVIVEGEVKEGTLMVKSLKEDKGM